jgi:acylphosphatase
MKEIVGVHVVVHGKVQGVGYRAFTESKANKIGLQGWVRNCHDGTVEVEAEGPKVELEAFLNVLGEGPLLAQVTQIIVDWKAANRQTQGFTIRRD